MKEKRIQRDERIRKGRKKSLHFISLHLCSMFAWNRCSRPIETERQNMKYVQREKWSIFHSFLVLVLVHDFPVCSSWTIEYSIVIHSFYLFSSTDAIVHNERHRSIETFHAIKSNERRSKNERNRKIVLRKLLLLQECMGDDWERFDHHCYGFFRSSVTWLIIAANPMHSEPEKLVSIGNVDDYVFCIQDSRRRSQN